MRKSEKHRLLRERGVELIKMLDSIERLDDGGNAVFEERRKLRLACYSRGNIHAPSVRSFDDFHDDCDYCALVFAARKGLNRQ